MLVTLVVVVLEMDVVVVTDVLGGGGWSWMAYDMVTDAVMQRCNIIPIKNRIEHASMSAYAHSNQRISARGH